MVANPAPARDRLPAARRPAVWLAGIGVAVLAAAAFVLSYDGLAALAREGGISPRLVSLYPVGFDALLVVALAAVFVLRSARFHVRWLVGLTALALLAAAAAADTLHALGTPLPHRPLAAGLAIAPWGMLAVAFRLWLSMLRHVRYRAARGSRAEDPPAAPAHDPGIVPGIDAAPPADPAAVPAVPGHATGSPAAPGPAGEPGAVPPQTAQAWSAGSAASSSEHVGLLVATGRRSPETPSGHGPADGPAGGESPGRTTVADRSRDAAGAAAHHGEAGARRYGEEEEFVADSDLDDPVCDEAEPDGAVSGATEPDVAACAETALGPAARRADITATDRTGERDDTDQHDDVAQPAEVVPAEDAPGTVSADRVDGEGDAPATDEAAGEGADVAEVVPAEEGESAGDDRAAPDPPFSRLRSSPLPPGGRNRD